MLMKAAKLGVQILMVINIKTNNPRFDHAIVAWTFISVADPVVRQ